MIRYLCIRKLSSVSTVIAFKINWKFLEDLSSNQIVKHLSDIKYNEMGYSKLEKRYPEYISLKNISLVIEGMLKLIFDQRVQIQQQLITLFRLEKTQDLILRVKALDISITSPFQALLALDAYTFQYINFIPQINSVVFVSDNEKQRAKQNIKIVLKMMVEKDVVLSELIGFLAYCRYRNKLPQITLTTQMRVHNFFQNNRTIQNLLTSFGVPKNERYRVLNIDPSAIELSTTYFEPTCIINRQPYQGKNINTERFYMKFSNKSQQKSQWNNQKNVQSIISNQHYFKLVLHIVFQKILPQYFKKLIQNLKMMIYDIKFIYKFSTY